MKRIITANDPNVMRAISLGAAKKHLRIYHNELDSLIISYIDMAVDWF